MAGNSAHLVVAPVVAGFSAPMIGTGWMKHHEGRVWFWAGCVWLGLLSARIGSGRGMNEGTEVVVTPLACGVLVLAHLLNRSLATTAGPSLPRLL